MFMCLLRVPSVVSRMKTFRRSALFVLFVLTFIHACCEATEVLANTGDQPTLHVGENLQRFERSSNYCPWYHYPVSQGNCAPCECGKGEEPKKNCGYGTDGALSDPCEQCGDSQFSTDGRINGCEFCTDCGQRGFQMICSRTEDATCVCEEGQKLGRSGQCLPVCCKCSGSVFPRDADNADACIREFGSPAASGGYLCSDGAYAKQPCQDFQPPLPPTTNVTTTVSVTNGSTAMPDTTTGAGKTVGSTNITSTPTVAESTSTVADVATGTPQANGTQPGTPSDEPSHDVGHQHTILYIGLALGLSTLTTLALIGVGCKRKKIYQKLKCMKKCWERKPTTDTARAALLHEEHGASDVESVHVPDGPPDVLPDLDQFGEQQETGETGGEAAGLPNDAVPISAGKFNDDLATPEGAEENAESEDNSSDVTVPKDVVSGVSETTHPPGLKEDDDETETDFPETGDEEGAISDAVPFIPEFIQQMPLEAILNEEDLLYNLRIKLEQSDRHFRNIGSHFDLTHDELDFIEFTELRGKDSPLKAILNKIAKSNENITVGDLLTYCNDTLKRRDVVKTIVKYFEQKYQESQEMEVKEEVTNVTADSHVQLEECCKGDSKSSEMEEQMLKTTAIDADVCKENASEQSSAQEKSVICELDRGAIELVEIQSR